MIDTEFDLKITLRILNSENMYMLDSDQEPLYNLSKNILLLPRILKLIEDMVDDSTPLYFLPAPVEHQQTWLRSKMGISFTTLADFSLASFPPPGFFDTGKGALSPSDFFDTGKGALSVHIIFLSLRLIYF